MSLVTQARGFSAEVARKRLEPFRGELALYFRELPALVHDKRDRQFFVARGTQWSLWDTLGDALRWGHEHFGLEAILVHKVDSRDLDRLQMLFPD
jgi:hypothetical protein